MTALERLVLIFLGVIAAVVLQVAQADLMSRGLPATRKAPAQF